MISNILKIFASATLTSPLLTRARIDCGSHKVLNVYRGGDRGTVLFAGTETDGAVTKYARPAMNVFNIPGKVRTLGWVMEICRSFGKTASRTCCLAVSI